MKYYYKLLEIYDNDDNQIESNADLTIFNDFFINLFALKDFHSKKKKIYFEIKNCLLKINFCSESMKIVEKLYLLYPQDLIIIFEYFKICLYMGELAIVDEIYNKFKKLFFESSEEKKVIYENYLNFTE